MPSGIKVEYLQHMGGDVDVVNAARVSFRKEIQELGIRDIGLVEFCATGMRSAERDMMRQRILGTGHRMDDDEAAERRAILAADKIIDDIQAITKHWSVFTHVVIKLRLTLPISTMRQMGRSGVGMSPPQADDFGFNEESRRYISHDPLFAGYDEWHDRPDDVKQGSGVPLPAGYQKTLHGMQRRLHGQALENYRDAIAMGAAPEEARDLLPLSTLTTVIWTGSLYAWANLCRQRLDPHAQGRAQEAARQISAIIFPLAPISWNALVLRGAKPHQLPEAGE
jgi:thymidylate synthase (FAD)